jgi:hypothetical protein
MGARPRNNEVGTAIRQRRVNVADFTWIPIWGTLTRRYRVAVLTSLPRNFVVSELC